MAEYIAKSLCGCGLSGAEERRREKALSKERCLDVDHAARIEGLTEDLHRRQYSRGQQAAMELIGISFWYINRKSALALLGTKTISKVDPQLRYLSILPRP